MNLGDEDILQLLKRHDPELFEQCSNILARDRERRGDIRWHLEGVCYRLGINTVDPSPFAFAEELPEGEIHIGAECSEPNLPKEFYLPEECLTSSHLFVAGETGSGKSRLIAILVVALKAGRDG